MNTSNVDPLVARIALSLMLTVKRVDRVARITEVQPWERASLVSVPESLEMHTATISAFEGI